MADHVLETRILLRYDTFNSWIHSDTILKAGEVAIAAFPNADPNLPPRAIGIKVGNGRAYFDELPWILAVASDVYSWAKESTKPNYSANEIEGLTEFINNMGGGGGGSSGGTSSVSTYRLSYDSNNKKYILLYYDEEVGDWVNASGEVNLSEIYNRINTIERWANGAKSNLGNIELPISEYIYDEVMTYLNRLDYSDDGATEHQFVTSVVLENGQISVVRSTISTNDITSGILPITRGGTGLNYIEENLVLVGDANGNITLIEFVTEIDNERYAFATVGAIKDYVLALTAGLTGAMHFIGETNVSITTNPISRVNPNIPNYNFSLAQPGDVILANNMLEFVWTGDYWRLLGDEGSYAIKGSIVNSDIADNAAIAQYKIANLTETFETKVDKVEGKLLSSNDYTTEEKLKLSEIAERANVNTIEGITLNNETLTPDQNKIVNLTVNEFDAASRAKLDTIEENAQVNTIEGITLNGTPLSPDINTKIVALTVKEFSDEDRRKFNTIAEGAQVNTIETIYLNNKEITPDLNKRIDLTIREYSQDEENKVKDIDEKLKTIESGAQVNVIEEIKVDGVTFSPNQNKIVEITTNPHTEHENVIESISFNGTVVQPDNNKLVNITYTLNDHPEHENIIEEILINGTTQIVNNKVVNLLLNESTLDVGLITGAQIPGINNNIKEDITIISKKLLLARIADSGDVQDLLQTLNTYIILDCGTSNSDIHNE